jgi:hypothetical protein
VEKTLTVEIELPLVQVVLMENFLLLDLHQQMIVNMVNINGAVKNSLSIIITEIL